MSWKNGVFADPIVPEGDVILTVLRLEAKETAGGTPFVSIMARIDEFMGDYDADDEAVLAPEGQTVFGSIWLPKEEDDLKKANGKQRRVRAFMEVMEHAGADIKDFDSPVEVLLGNLGVCAGQKFKTLIEHRVDDSGTYPTKAEISMFRVKRA